MSRAVGGFLQNTPDATKHLLVINGLFFLATLVLEGQGIGLIRYLGAYYPDSPLFEPYQIVTHMFMHGSFGHIFMNMFALWMFGSVLERTWGTKRYLFYYLVTGLGAFALHYAVMGIEVYDISGSLTNPVYLEGDSIYYSGMAARGQELLALYMTPVVGASGAVFGLLLGFAMYFPNQPLYLMFIPVPIKAKYFVAGYALIELLQGVQNSPGDSVAHFAHLGGVLFGYIIIKIWRKNDCDRWNQGFH